MNDVKKRALEFILTKPDPNNKGGRMGAFTGHEFNNSDAIQEIIMNNLGLETLWLTEWISKHIDYDISKINDIRQEINIHGGVHIDGQLNPIESDGIDELLEMIEQYIFLILKDEDIDPKLLNDEEQKEGLYNSYELINYLYPRATKGISSKNVAVPKITEIKTFELIDYFNQKIENDGETFLPYLSTFRKNTETGKIYNVELFLFYGFITSIGWGHTFLTNQYGKRWDKVIEGTTNKLNGAIAWGDKPPSNVENLYNFAITYQPNKMNQYAIKFLIDVGMSFKAISERLNIKMDKSKKSHHYKSVVLPKPPIKIGK